MPRGETKTSAKRKVLAPGATKKRTQSMPKASCPKYTDMVTQALFELHDRKGTSRQAITKWIKANFSVGQHSFAHCLKNALNKLVEEEKIVQVKGSFKLTPELRIQLKPYAHKPTKEVVVSQPSKKVGTKRKSAPIKSSPASKRAKTSTERSTKKTASRAKKISRSEESDQLSQEESETKDEIIVKPSEIEEVSTQVDERQTERLSESEAESKEGTTSKKVAEGNVPNITEETQLRQSLASHPGIEAGLNVDEAVTKVEHEVQDESVSAAEAAESSLAVASELQDAKQSEPITPPQVSESHVESQAESASVGEVDKPLSEKVFQEVEPLLKEPASDSALDVEEEATTAESQHEKSDETLSRKHAEPTVQENELYDAASEEPNEQHTDSSLHVEEQAPGEPEEGTPVVNNAVVLEPQDESRSASPGERSESDPDQTME